jgi:hypothetical protein
MIGFVTITAHLPNLLAMYGSAATHDFATTCAVGDAAKPSTLVLRHQPIQKTRIHCHTGGLRITTMGLRGGQQAIVDGASWIKDAAPRSRESSTTGSAHGHTVEDPGQPAVKSHAIRQKRLRRQMRTKRILRGDNARSRRLGHEPLHAGLRPWLLLRGVDSLRQDTDIWGMKGLKRILQVTNSP